MRIIAIANQKGGVGKTTTTLNLGVALTELGKKVFVVDFDPQASLTLAMGIDSDDLETTIYNVMATSLRDRNGPSITEAIIKTQAGLDLLPSSIEFSQAQLDLVTVMSRERVLEDMLAPAREHYDFILIDCLPSLDLLTINALTAADEVLIPVQADYLAMKGIRLLLQTINRVKAKLNPRLKICGVLLTMADFRTLHSQEVAEATRRTLGERVKVFDTIIRMSVRIKESSATGQSILTYYQGKSSGADEYRQLAKEVLESA